ncbi:CheA signal transduction histidine kinase [Rhodomicrobium vannielii ATCC 17100]|uniref:Chemotaxis protein CheA n=1 Tax=Rhodomicrobium vannielii (strain ATCC 17100 / DSM 162 / LMG 4299 / NCIMB 10020 / ATH 3.1.1) TaxID=648757 RepID=E3I695_RHOVT|nr:chemotaxis protein CheA [Rhodomicrobium vannielii]ADP71760.1 CheA signal transduction histidine kinase [Rhodomicrobium vannielii ATCC 17100]
MSSDPTSALDLNQFRATFFDECAEVLPDLDSRLSTLDANAADSENLNAIFRAVHSIKAGAAAFNFRSLVTFAHGFEALLDRLRDDRMELSADVASVCLRAGDVLAALVDAAQMDTAIPEGFGADVLAEVEGLMNSDVGRASFPEATAAATDDGEMRIWRITFTPHRELFRHANEPLLIIRELKRLGELDVCCDRCELPDLERLDPEESYLGFSFRLRTKASRAAIDEVFEFVDQDCDLVVEVEPAETPRETKVPPRALSESLPAAGRDGSERKAKSPSFVRVDLARVDRLINMVGELVITQAMLTQQLSEHGTNMRDQRVQGADELAAHIRELQECVMAIRMQPARTVFARMGRLVRDLSHKLGKKVRLVTSGDETEVDKTIVEELVDPITHMIRNAIDHGIEMPELRLAAGKPEEAVIHLSATQRAGNILITIADDGAGIDTEKVLAKAISKGIVRDDAKLSEEEIHELIFAPGFSTAEKVTEVSGRGVGMDVVRRNIASIGGRIHTNSVQGQGSSFTLVIPLTLAVLDGMHVAVREEKYIIPLASIVETVRPDRRQIRSVAGGDVIFIRGEYIRLIHLHRLFNVAGEGEDSHPSLVVVVETENGTKAGLVVDELIGQQQFVFKNLNENADPVPGIAGATILGNGRVALILNLEDICSIASASLDRYPKSEREHGADMPDQMPAFPRASASIEPVLQAQG